MKCNCEHEGNFPINIIQGDSYRRVYTFYDKDGEVITAEHIGAVYWNCARLEYQQELKYNAEDENWIFYLSSTETADFAYCKTTYDLTLYFTDEQVETEIYSSELRILEKKNKPSAGSYSGGEPFDTNGIATHIYTGLVVTAGGGGIKNHDALTNRDIPNQHPMSAITGLEEALDGKANSGDIPTKTSDLENDSGFIKSIPSQYITDSELNTAIQSVETQIPTKVSDLENDNHFVTDDYVDNIDVNLQEQIDNLQAEKMPVMTVDTVPTDGSTNLVESGGVYDAIDNVQITLQEQIDVIVSSSDVKDVVGTYAELQNYDTSILGNNDIVKVLDDSTHNNARSYYRWVINSGVGSWLYIGSEAISYTKSEADALLKQKQNAIADLNSIRSGAELGATSVQPADLTNYALKDDLGAFVIDYSNPVATDYTNAIAAFDADREVKLRRDNTELPMTGYDSNHCFFGGTVSAYLPGGYVIAVYAHIGTNGQNYFWYQYNSPVEAAGLYSEDKGNYFTSTNVMGQLQEIGAKLAAYPSEVWEGGSYGG